MTDTAVVFEKVGKTAVITLNRPRKKNALDRSIRDALPAAIEAAREDDSVRCVVLTGAGGDFCSGADLKAAPGEGEKAFAGRDVVGLARAKEIVFSAREIAADEALELGLVQAVVAAERLRDAALEFARRFDDAPTRALGLAKGILNRSFETDRHAMTQMEAAAQSLCAASDFHVEAVRRFGSREAPLFGGAALLPPCG